MRRYSDLLSGARAITLCKAGNRLKILIPQKTIPFWNIRRGLRQFPSSLAGIQSGKSVSSLRALSALTAARSAKQGTKYCKYYHCVRRTAFGPAETVHPRGLRSHITLPIRPKRFSSAFSQARVLRRRNHMNARLPILQGTGASCSGTPRLRHAGPMSRSGAASGSRRRQAYLEGARHEAPLGPLRRPNMRWNHEKWDNRNNTTRDITGTNPGGTFLCD